MKPIIASSAACFDQDRLPSSVEMQDKTCTVYFRYSPTISPTSRTLRKKLVFGNFTGYEDSGVPRVFLELPTGSGATSINGDDTVINRTVLHREMAPKGTAQPGAPHISHMGRPPNDDISLGGEEEGATSLAGAGPPSRDGNGQNNSRQDIRRTRRNHHPAQKGTANANRILDWFLGRNIQLTCEDSTISRGVQTQEHKYVTEDDFFDIGDVRDICPACTTPYCQAIDSIPLKSSLKLIYNDHTSQKWLIGNKYVLHEVLDDHPKDEYVSLVEASRALKTLAPNVPTPKVRVGWKENGKIITISDAVPGERLYDIWWDLSNKERGRIAAQVAGYIEDWRRSDLGQISGLTGGPVYDHDNLFGTAGDGFGPFESDLDLWNAIEKRLVEKGMCSCTKAR
ncbi:hypothetical protein O1611_g8883 [Lasiodiplodia mahajangana]|uniref:Uncharacterized protein n=1 Tax=Lasiodiplodia mahajangana TaxID=1108764 RepID=A0ACC2JBI4_9PEZI|nr:hypothetical protein O1611_g8883 [Lasiodiplodia mahajangana]